MLFHFFLSLFPIHPFNPLNELFTEHLRCKAMEEHGKQDLCFQKLGDCTGGGGGGAGQDTAQGTSDYFILLDWGQAQRHGIPAGIKGSIGTALWISRAQSVQAEEAYARA